MNVARATMIMKDYNLDGLLATTHENVRYLSGFRSFTQPIVRGTQVYAIVRRDLLESPFAVAPLAEADMAVQFPPRGAFIPYGTFHVFTRVAGASGGEAFVGWGTEDPTPTTPLAALQQAFIRLELQGRIGVDERGLAPSTWKQLEEKVGTKVSLVPATDVFYLIRAVKTEQEVAWLTSAARIVEEAIREALRGVEEGLPERELAKVFNREVITRGGHPLFSVIAFGSHSAYPNAIPGERPLRRGDLIRFDVGCLYCGYCADISRTAVFGEPSPRQQAYYQAILAGEEAALDLLRPGVKVSDVFEVAVEATRKHGIPHYRRHHVGHGIGLEIYEPPLLSADADMRLEEGMVLEVETPYYEIDFGGLQVEDSVVITGSRNKILTLSDRSLWLV